MVSVCLPSDALLQHLLSYLGFSYLGCGYLFTAAPAKRSQCSLPWTRGISSPPPFLTFNVVSIVPLGLPVPVQPLHGVGPPGRRPWPRAWGCSSRLPPLAYKKDLHDPNNHDGVITDLQPDILEYEVKWALESITTNKASVQLFATP